MLYIPKIGSSVEILTDDEVKDFVAINFRQFLNLQEKYCILN